MTAFALPTDVRIGELHAATEPSFENGFQGGHYLGYRLRPGYHGLLAEPMAAGNDPFDTRAVALRAGQRSIYHNRNRTYDPFLGRFFQHDPNSTGQVLASLASQGRLGWSPPGAFDHNAWFTDGGNLYVAYGHDPVNATDPNGLFFTLPGLLTTTGKRLGQAANAYGGYETANGVVEDIANGVAMEQILLGLAFDAIFDVAGGKVLDAALSGIQGVRKGIQRACNCVPGGTLVATPEGAVPIAELEAGDYVLSVEQTAPAAEPVWARVEAVIERETAEFVRLQFSDGTGLSLTDSHLIWVDQEGWIKAGDVLAGDLIRTAGRGVLRVERAVREAVEPTTTYTLQVEGTRTYFADGVWVHNSCFGSVGRALGLRNAIEAAKRQFPDAGRVYSNARDAKAITKGHKSEIQAHHLIEQRLLKQWGRDLDNVPTVILPKDVHNEITQALRKEMPYGHQYTEAQAKVAYQRVYEAFPEWLGPISSHFK